jgi:tetratricopeptide (TPR) repeat protein
MKAQRRRFLTLSGWLLLPVAVIACGSLHARAQSASAPQPGASNSQAIDLMQRGLNLAAHGQLAQAEILLEQARAESPGNLEVLTALAKVKDRVGELPAAISIFREIVDAAPRSTEAHLNLAMALADNSDLNGALDEASKAVAISPKSASAHLNRARILADLHRLNDSRAEFEVAAKLMPTNPDCFFYWALVEKENGNNAKELELLRIVVRLQPRNAKALTLLGECLSTASMPTESIAIWRRVLAIDPDSSEATYSLSQALRSTDPAESKRLLEHFHAIQQREKQVKQVNSLGNQAYEAMNDQKWPEAIAVLREAIPLCGDCEFQAKLHKDLGLALCRNGDMREGEAELRIALHLNPADPDVLRALKMISH